ncbi:MAG: hypothetical protein ABSG84_14745 [Acidobacteriaceae bacterium]|jgi:hypothetical protein
MQRHLLQFTLLISVPGFAQVVAVIPHAPTYNLQVLPGSTRQINVQESYASTTNPSGCWTATLASGGSGFVAGDTHRATFLKVKQGSADGCMFMVTAVSGGAVTGISATAVPYLGGGYVTGNDLATDVVGAQGGSETGATVNLTSLAPCVTSAGFACTFNWSVVATTGGASATLTDPTHTAVSSISGALGTILVGIGPTAGSCSISGSLGSYNVSSTATVAVRAQSVDSPAKTATFLFNVCAKTTSVMVAPAYQQCYQNQIATLQSWVTGDVDETGTWSITTSPAGGNGALADTGNRDAAFSCGTVTGRYVLAYTSHSNSSKSATAIVYVSPNSLPSYAATPNGTRPTECYPDPALKGRDFEVGSGFAYPTPIAAPAWDTWPAGTIMRIHNTDRTGENPTVYSNYMQIENSGTATQPVIICGVPDSHGNLPILDGTNATTQSTTSIALDGYGIIFTWPGPARGHYNYWQSGSTGPSYLTISGLHLRNATPRLRFVAPRGGSSPWVDGDGCIYLGSGSYIDIVGDELEACANGLATYANGNNAFATITQQVTVRGNHLTNNGYRTSAGDHQMYNQSWFTLVEGNRIDNYLSTATGANIKFRGIEGIFRYNYLGLSSSGSNGPTRDFDLVENQDAFSYSTFEGYLSHPGDTNCDDSLWCLGDQAGANVIAAYQESAQKDFIYGNLVLNAGAAYQQIHYGMDHDAGMASRNGTLYFYNNTMDHAAIVFETNGNGGSDPFLQPRVDFRNNILWNPTANHSGSGIAFSSYESGILLATTNLMYRGSFSIATPITGGSYSDRDAYGWGAGCDYWCEWPLSNPINLHLYNLTNADYLSTLRQPYTPGTLVPGSGSAAIGAGTALSGILATMPVRWNYNVATSALTVRQYPLTLGAEDQGGVAQTAWSTLFPNWGRAQEARVLEVICGLCCPALLFGMLRWHSKSSAQGSNSAQPLQRPDPPLPEKRL